jgi:diacylglycerol kinase family enzyme
VRALLIVNPHATSTNPLRRDVIVRALASALDLEVAETNYRGHARMLAAAAASGECDLLLTLGGDGTVNEAVNGLLTTGQQAGLTAEELPLLASLPGGNANVFARALGLATDLVDATGQILESVVAGKHRLISVGQANDRFFTFNAGMGLDAEVVRAVEGRRAHGKELTPALYLRMALRQFYRMTDRHHPPIRMLGDDGDRLGSMYWCAVSNTSPWTFLGSRPVLTNPQASFETGLDVFGLRSLATAPTLLALGKILAGSGREPNGWSIVSLHDLPELTLAANRPAAVQVDGEYIGEYEQVVFTARPRALRAVC